LGRAESLYRSAVSKPDLDYSSQLLFASLVANPGNREAFEAILGKIGAFAAAGRKMVVRAGDSAGNGAADSFIKTLAAYCAGPSAEAGIACAVEAQKVGLFGCAATLGMLALQQVESAQASLKSSGFTRLIDALDGSGAAEAAVRAARAAVQEDFRELVRAVREAPQGRREAALEVLKDGHDRFGERETLWFIREIRLERKRAELRAHRQKVEEKPDEVQLRQEYQRMRAELLREHVDHLYELVSSLPNSPERHRREMELAGKLFEAGRFEEAIKQAQAAKRRSGDRLDAWMIMAKSFVQLGLTPEAGECFESILGELNAAAGGSASIGRVLEAKYSYAEFLVQQAEKTGDLVLARQARKLCSDVMVEDIDFRGVRALSGRADKVIK